MTIRHRSGAGAHAMISPVFGSRRGGNGVLTTAISGELCGLFGGDYDAGFKPLFDLP